MNIQTSKIELVKMILHIENDKFIQKSTEFIQKEKVDLWNDLSLSEQREIENGVAALSKGKRIEFNDLVKKIS